MPVFDVVSSGWVLALRSMRIQVREHALGYAWTLLTPLIYAVCYVMVKRELAGGAGMPSKSDFGWDLVRVFGGLLLFQVWMQLLQAMADVIRKHRSFLRGMSVGAEPFVFAIAFEHMLALGIRVLIIVAAVVLLGLSFTGTWATWGWCALGLASLLLSASAIGLVLAPWSSLFGDVRKVLQSATLPLVLVSPIFYPPSLNTQSPVYWVNSINPIGAALSTISEGLRGVSHSVHLLPMVVWAAVASLIVLWSVYRLRVQLPIVLERLS